MLSITLSEPGGLASLAGRWRQLQADAACSFFQSWNWVGCLAAERFPDPVLLEAREDGRTLALALFNRGRRRLGTETLWLGESGIPALDSVFVEHNGPLVARGRGDLLTPCLRAALEAPIGPGRKRTRRLVVSGMDEALLPAISATGAVWLREQARPAPYVDFTQLRGDWLGSLSANTRYQLRRSRRAYEQSGPLTVHRAASVPEARETLDALAALHQCSWTSRGRPGAFAEPGFLRFHHELIARAFPDGEIDLLRIAAGSMVVGYLYNFRFRGNALAYQSGFDYTAAGPHQKPGLTCHHLAIEMYRAEGADRYDFLAGGDRYKTSLANAEIKLHWLELAPNHPVPTLVAALRRAVSTLRSRVLPLVKR